MLILNIHVLLIRNSNVAGYSVFLFAKPGSVNYCGLPHAEIRFFGSVFGAFVFGVCLVKRYGFATKSVY